jgi:ubiquitin fusion degradation protein 1
VTTDISGPRIITSDSYDQDRKVPAALNLPEGKFFFGYTYVPFDPDKVVKKQVDIAPAESFGGQGTSLRSQTKTATAADAESAKPEADKPAEDPWAKLGGGNTLSAKVKKETAEPKTASRQQQEVIDATMLEEEEFWDDEGMYEDDDDIIEIDSD